MEEAVPNYGYAIQQTADEGYIVAGDSYSTNGDVTGNHGDEDYWIVKLAPPPPKVFSSTQQTFPPILCGTQALDTLWVHNTGGGQLIINSYSYGSTEFSLLFPPAAGYHRGGGFDSVYHAVFAVRRRDLSNGSHVVQQ